ncbi:PBP1A family penicillin-binding protein [Synechococcus sp. RSCCF101]|nr:PBP1A family penicillin-binding protein [Synechococcus sp. RSCCF101]
MAQDALTRQFDALLPEAGQVSNFNRPGTLTILASDGTVLQKLGPATREKLSPETMPLLVKQAFVAAEDRRFYEHNGVDARGIMRALARNVRSGEVREGASTITQQLARTVFLSQDRTVARKLREAALAYKIERQLSKEEILTQYLNYVYLGASAYGVADAAWVYYSKSVDQLTLPEAALIAGLPPAPSVYSPLVNADLARERRNLVLERMEQAGFISEDQRAAASAAPLDLNPATPKYFNSRAPYFTSWVAQELPGVLSLEQLETGGITIRTSLNLDWQKRGLEVIRKNAGGSMQGALVSMEPGTGLVRAMVGGKDFNASQFNRASQALRSPGSTFKLFAYTAAIGAGLKPEDTFSNAQRCYPAEKFCIKGKGGKTTMVNGFARSLNAFAVDVAEKVGYDDVIETARDLGLTEDVGAYPAMVLGANEQTVVDMTAAYAGVVNRGLFVPPTPFEEIRGPEDEILWSRRVDGEAGRRAVETPHADAMVWMMQQVVTSGTGRGAALPDRQVAGKTGTSEGARDLWFIGSVPQLTTSVWLGYDNNRKTGSSSGAAAWAWQQYMKQITEDMPVQTFPPKPALTGSFKPRQKRQGESRDSSGGSSFGWDTLPEDGETPAPSASDPAPGVQTPWTPSPGAGNAGGPPVNENFEPPPLRPL